MSTECRARIKRESGPPSGFWEYTEYEGAARSIKCYENFLVTGLLQTEEYAREVLRSARRPEALEQLVATRTDRQEILGCDEPPWLTVLLDESIIRRVVGGSAVMRGQLKRLLAAIQEPTTTVRIVPEQPSIYPSGPFSLLYFDDAPSVAYVEGVGGHGQVIEEGRQVQRLEVLFDQIGAVALPVADSEELIQSALEDL